MIHQAIADAQATTTYSRKQLKKKANWQDWKQSEWKQLDNYKAQHMFGAPCRRPSKATVLPWVWSYYIKDNGTLKARGTCNGGKRYGKAVTLAYTYASCVEQPIARLFWALAASEGMYVVGADAGNAFAEAPPPQQQFYMEIGDQFREWWTEHLGNPPIPKDYVLPVLRAIQGHPESPRLWDKHITKILKAEDFTNTTHERSIYQATIQGCKVLFLRQVDDFAIACTDLELAKTIKNKIGSHLSVPLNDLGIIEKFNGVNINQTDEYIRISCESFINRILEHHQWHETNTQYNPIPMRDDATYLTQLELAALPATQKEREDLQKQYFNYRQVIGEVIYAMTVARPDISSAVIKLSQYSNNPAKIHYQALRHLVKYLALTKHRGIHFWHRKKLQDLPTIDPEPCVSNTDANNCIPQSTRSNIIHGYVDSDWGSDKQHRKSVTGIAIMLAGGVIAYKTKYQPTIALSSTEAEFAAAAEAGKMILYIRSILHELGYSQKLPTVLFEDNAGALHMANSGQPTKRTRHMDMKHFAIQDWIEHDHLKLERVDTQNNISDTFTKSVGRIKFYEQPDILMGRRPPFYTKSYRDRKNVHPSRLHRNVPIEHEQDLSKIVSSLLPTCTWLAAAA